MVPEEAEAMMDEVGSGAAAAGNSNVEEAQSSFSKSSRALSSSSRSVSVKYVNELGDGVGGSHTSLRSVTKNSTLCGKGIFDNHGSFNHFQTSGP